MRDVGIGRRQGNGEYEGFNLSQGEARGTMGHGWSSPKEMDNTISPP